MSIMCSYYATKLVCDAIYSMLEASCRSLELCSCRKAYTDEENSWCQLKILQLAPKSNISS